MTLQLKGIQTSETLRNDIFKKQPGASELQINIESMVAQFSPKNVSPKVQEVLDRIGYIWDALASIAWETRAEIVNLYTETVATTHFTDYSGKVALLEAHQRNRISNILGVPSDANFNRVV